MEQAEQILRTLGIERVSVDIYLEDGRLISKVINNEKVEKAIESLGCIQRQTGFELASFKETENEDGDGNGIFLLKVDKSFRVKHFIEKWELETIREMWKKQRRKDEMLEIEQGTRLPDRSMLGYKYKAFKQYAWGKKK